MTCSKTEAGSYGVTLSYYLRALIDQYSPIKLPPLKTGAPEGNRNAAGKRKTGGNRGQSDERTMTQ